MKNEKEERNEAAGGGRMTLKRALPQILAVNAKNILLLGYGLTLGFPTIVIPAVMEATKEGEPARRDSLTLTMDQISWFSSINLLCVPIGCLLSGVMTQPFGRKPSMIALNLPFIAAWIMFYYADSVAMMYTSLAITGFTGGLLEAPVLTYVAEITEPEVRGILSAMSSMCVILGVFLQFLMGTLMHWRTVALVNIAFPLSAVLAISFVPESPHWLLGKGKVDKAEKSLMWLRGWVSAAQVQTELSTLKEAITKKGGDSGGGGKPRAREAWAGPSAIWRPYTKAPFLRPYAVVTLTFFVGHFGGMTTLQTFAVGIFAAVGSPLDKYVSTVVLGLVELLGAVVCMCLVRTTGKRPLALASTAGGALCFLLVACYTPLAASGSVPSLPWLPLIGLVTAAFFTHVCLRLLPWMLIGEVYTAEVRATASGASGGIGYILGFAANKSYLYLVKVFDVWGTLLFYGIIGLAGLVALYFFLPETEGLTLLQVQEHFDRKKREAASERNQKSDDEKAKWAASNPALDDAESHF